MIGERPRGTHRRGVPGAGGTLHIVEATLREIELPLKERFVISSGWWENRRILLLHVRDAHGVETWAECVCGHRPNYSPETIDTAWLALEAWLLPKVLGVELEGPAIVKPLLDDGVNGHPMAKAVVEMAYWGLGAESEGVSLSDFIGGTREVIPVGISLGIQKSPSALVAKALEAVERGYRKVKLKIMPGADIEYVAAVREALGPDQALAVDANAAYTLEDSDLLVELDAFGLVMIEQPLAAGDLYRHARLQELVSTPLCLDESIIDPASCEDMLALGSGRIVSIKPGRVGGFGNARRIHDISQHGHVPVCCGGMLESGIGRAYNVALASLPNFELPGDLSPSARYWAEDIVVPEWTMSSEGFVTVPRDRPGLGIEVDIERIEALTTRAKKFEAGSHRGTATRLATKPE